MEELIIMDKICFVVCPIGEDGSDIRKRSDQLLRHIIEPVCKEKGYKAVRVDKITNTDKIDQTIIEHLQKSELVIADLSEHNPNAFFEIGFRSALNRPLIHITEEGQSLPFDVLSIRTIFYNLTDPDKILETKERLSETINAICVNDDSARSADSESPETHAITSNINSQILTNLLDIKDSINNLHKTVDEKDNKLTEQIISVFANKIQENNNPSNTPENRAMEIFITEFMKNPEKAMNSISKLNQMPNFPRLK
jgi:hypothetical protein